MAGTTATFRIWRGDAQGGALQDYTTDVSEGRVVRDAMHLLDTARRARELKRTHGVGYCNSTKCCTKVCPESITITDNAIIPPKERVIDQLYDPVAKLFRMLRSR